MNPAVYIPLINIVLTITILLGIVKSCSGFWIKMVPVAIFIDLFLFGHFFNPIWRNNIALDKSTNHNKSVEYLQSTGIVPYNYRILSTLSTTPLRTNTEELMQTLFCNSNSLYEIESINGFSGFILKRYSDLLGMDEAGMANFDWLIANNRLISMLGVKYILSNIHQPDYIKLTPCNEKPESWKFEKWIDLKPNSHYRIEMVVNAGSNSKGEMILSIFGYSRKREPLLVHSITIGEGDSRVKEEVLDFHTDSLRKDEYYFEMANSSSVVLLIEHLSMIDKNTGKNILFPAEKTSAELAAHDDYIKSFQKDSITIFENKKALPRGFLVSKFCSVKDSQETVSLLRDNEFDIDLSKEVLIESDTGPLALAEGKGRVSFISHKPNEVLVQVNAQGNKILVMSEVYYPGWRVYIDGKEDKIFRVNGILMGVLVPDGNHLIQMVYVPVSFKIGLAISVLAWIVVICYFIRFIVRKRHVPA
ncbi:MAG: YfhO family protein [Nitrospinae bacterium]|nr:YfhO family protein [Nitrospinota bacterium]